MATSASVIGAMRAAVIPAILAGAMMTAPTRTAQQTCPNRLKPECSTNAKVDIAFIVDRSGSMDSTQRGQTYNVQIEGVRRALLDPTIIPRDASLAVTILTFADEPSIPIPTMVIRSEADAAGMAADVAALKCMSASTCPGIGPVPASDFGKAISAADLELSRTRSDDRINARRVFLMSTDGGCSDLPDCGKTASQQARNHSPVGSELDVALVGLRTTASEFSESKGNVDAIVFPQPKTDLPGETLVIEAGNCNNPGQTDINNIDCENQVNQFVDFTRRILLRNSSPLIVDKIEVTTERDTEPGEPPSNNQYSLRQAIEMANNQGGSITITFAVDLKNFKPRIPLPALTAPEITIDGFAGRDRPECVPPLTPDCFPQVTIDGVMTDTTGGERHCDGILIRSNRDVVRGLRIANFGRAGVAVEPACPSDKVGHNRIEQNVFENNGNAGVCVIDSQFGPSNAVPHNVGNTISRNNIFGNVTPIDLACDGLTPNDEGDLDEGPNTLLNFPDSVDPVNSAEVNAAGATVTVRGQVNSPPAGGLTVEIFAATFRRIQNSVVLDSVVYLGSTSFVGKSFTASDLPVSPTGAYSATLTDSNGNTSELAICSNAPKPVVTPGSLEFPEISVGETESLSFAIKNTGCAPLTNLAFKSLTRSVSGTQQDDHSRVFSLASQVSGAIAPNDTRLFTLAFSPVIPPFFGEGKLPSSPEFLLPRDIAARLTLSSDFGDMSIDIVAHVAPRVYLINADGTQERPAPTLTRSGDIFEVTYYVFDSNPMDIKRAVFAFVDEGCSAVPVDNATARLKGVIKRAINQSPPTKLRGQSLKIVQSFSNANQHSDTKFVKVTIQGKTSEDTCCEFPCNQANTQAARNKPAIENALPPLRLGGARLNWRRATTRTEKRR